MTTTSETTMAPIEGTSHPLRPGAVTRPYLCAKAGKPTDSFITSKADGREVCEHCRAEEPVAGVPADGETAAIVRAGFAAGLMAGAALCRNRAARYREHAAGLAIVSGRLEHDAQTRAEESEACAEQMERAAREAGQ